MSKTLRYDFAPDLIRVVAIISVVTIHTAGSIYTNPAYVGRGSWWLAAVLYSFSRVSVPLFILLSGYFILAKTEPVFSSLKRMFTRILIPLLVWLCIYTIWNFGHPSIQALNPNFFYRMLQLRGSIFHLSYLVIAVGLYTAAPFLRWLLSRFKPKEQLYLTGFFLLLGIFSNVVGYFSGFCSASAFTIWVPYIGYFLLGYKLRNVKLSSRQYLIVGFTWFTAFVFTLGMNFLTLSLIAHKIYSLSPISCLANFSDHYLSPNVLVLSLSFFMLLIARRYRGFKSQHQRVVRLVHRIARSAFGIYLVHVIFINVFDDLLYREGYFLHFPLWAYLVTKLLVVFFVSYAVSTFCLRIPVVKRAFGGS